MPRPRRRRAHLILVPVVSLAITGGAIAAPAEVSLDFSSAIEGTASDKDGQGTGFTGTEGTSLPQQLDLDADRGVLSIASTPGDYIDNTQDNGLYVEVDGRGGFAVTTTIVGSPPLGEPNHGAGIWVGSGQDNYVKLVLIQVPDRNAGGEIIGSFPVIALGREEAGVTASFELDPASKRFDQMLDAERITLRLKVASDGSVTGRYADDRGVIHHVAPAEPLALAGITTDGIRAGLVATSKNASTSPTFTFDDFLVEGDAGASVVSRSPAPGAEGVGRNAPLSVRWDEQMSAESVTEGFSLAEVGGEPVPVASSVDTTGRRFTFVPTGTLAPNTEFRVSLDDIRQASGEPVDAVSWTFSTGAALGSDPGSGGVGSGRCLPVPVRVTASGGASISLDARQLRINQRISSAAVRRANALQKWIDSGITADDICGGAISEDQLASDVVTTKSVNPPSLEIASPRPLIVAAPQKASSGKITLSTRQLRINQRIASAALRRARALEVRMSSLTGGDLASGGQIRIGKLADGLAVTSLGATTTAPPSQTIVGPPGAGGGKIERSVRQLRINQRISAAAVRTLNRLVDQVAGGLTGANFARGSVAGSDIAPDARPE